MKHNILTLIRSEQYKSKGNQGALWALLFPVAIVLLGAAYAVFSGRTGVTWTSVYGDFVLTLFNLTYPMVIALVVFSLCSLEYRNDNLKLIFTLPVKASSIYVAKFTYLFFVVFASALAGFLSFILCGYIIGLSGAGTFDFAFMPIIAVAFVRLFIALMVIASIQNVISWLFRSFVTPVGFACFITFAAMFAFSGKTWYGYVPYVSIQKALRGMLNSVSVLDRSDCFGIAIILLFAILAAPIFLRLRKAKG
ncbi:MAG: ABC transporter permease [Tannerella sp.]|jgi:hypothetical protein|nr:ABC transporter permease [Tannerella sp.]